MTYIDKLRKEESEVGYILFELLEIFSNECSSVQYGLVQRMCSSIESRVTFTSFDFKDYIFLMNKIEFNSYDFEDLQSYYLFNKVTIDDVNYISNCMREYFKHFINTSVYSIQIEIGFNKLLMFMKELIEYEICY